jgi:hypothetical protein
MSGNKSEPNNGWDSYVAQSFKSGNFFIAFPIELELSESEVRTW